MAVLAQKTGYSDAKRKELLAKTIAVIIYNQADYWLDKASLELEEKQKRKKALADFQNKWELQLEPQENSGDYSCLEVRDYMQWRKQIWQSWCSDKRQKWVMPSVEAIQKAPLGNLFFPEHGISPRFRSQMVDPTAAEQAVVSPPNQRLVMRWRDKRPWYAKPERVLGAGFVLVGGVYLARLLYVKLRDRGLGQSSDPSFASSKA